MSEYVNSPCLCCGKRSHDCVCFVRAISAGFYRPSPTPPAADCDMEKARDHEAARQYADFLTTGQPLLFKLPTNGRSPEGNLARCFKAQAEALLSAQRRIAELEASLDR